MCNFKVVMIKLIDGVEIETKNNVNISSECWKKVEQNSHAADFENPLFHWLREGTFAQMLENWMHHDEAAIC